jgi:predicted regulator of amino acid metabolism with ACT domain
MIYLLVYSKLFKSHCLYLLAKSSQYVMVKNVHLLTSTLCRKVGVTRRPIVHCRELFVYLFARAFIACIIIGTTEHPYWKPLLQLLLPLLLRYYYQSLVVLVLVDSGGIFVQTRSAAKPLVEHTPAWLARSKGADRRHVPRTWHASLDKKDRGWIT